MKVKKIKFGEQVVKILAGGSASSRDIEELQTQITTNATDISNIKNGTTIDSFGDVESALGEKQDTLTFDDTPTENSANPVTSGGVYNSQEEQNTLIAELQEENTYLNSVINQLPKVKVEGEYPTLDNTLQAKMKVDLKGNTSQETSPTPDAPIPVNVVSGDNTIDICGKNLLDTSANNTTLNAYFNSANGLLTNDVTKKNCIFNEYILVKPNTTYTISSKEITDGSIYSYVEYDSDKNFIRYISSGDGRSDRNYTFTTGSTTSYIRIRYKYDNASDITNEIIESKELQLEQGSTATTYEPYQSQSYTINLGDIELCKIGDYQDYFYKESNKWYLHKEIAKKVLDGSENWNLNSNVSTDNFKVFYLYNAGMLEKANILCDKFKYINSRGAANCIWTPYSTEIDISISSLFVSTSQEFKTWLSNNNVLVYYVLATPTTTEITDTTLISQLEALKTATSYDNQTNISQINNDAPFIISASALYDLNNLVTRIQILESEV